MLVFARYSARDCNHSISVEPSYWCTSIGRGHDIIESHVAVKVPRSFLRLGDKIEATYVNGHVPSQAI